MLCTAKVFTDFPVGHYFRENNSFATKRFNQDQASHSSHVSSSRHRCHRASTAEEKSVTSVKVNGTEDLQNHTRSREEKEGEDRRKTATVKHQHFYPLVSIPKLNYL